MRRKSPMRVSVCIVVIVSFLTVSCAGVMQQPGQAALLCGVGGAAAGAAIGGAVSRDWKGALVGAAIGALVGGTTCFAIAEYRSRQVKDYQETRQAIQYEPSQGDSVQITQYAISPAAAAPGAEVAFNATYYVMTADPDQEIPITELRILRVYDAAKNQYRELGRVPNQVTVKPGTRQADGKFQVRSGVAEGKYLVIFQIAKNGLVDTKELPLFVTTNAAILGAESSRIAQVVAEGAKGSEPPSSQPPRPVQTPPGTEPSPAPAGPLASLGEREPKPPMPPASASVPAAPEGPKLEREKARYFVATNVVGTGNLRKGPGTQYAIVGEIKQGDRFPIIDRTTNPGEPVPWYKIRLETGMEAWVASGLGTEVQE